MMIREKKNSETIGHNQNELAQQLRNNLAFNEALSGENEVLNGEELEPDESKPTH